MKISYHVKMLSLVSLTDFLLLYDRLFSFDDNADIDLAYHIALNLHVKSKSTFMGSTELAF